ncbi:MAG: 16S rRNA (cytosine(1402)-N(4))-methyltransferase, partial [Candidatus Margulisbacteria bacterium]|nr:16S rRNA (cytosine(1402)-N(4))-methyltransferase [Candidatus Margulisiibacteriota bacterium]
MVFKHIPVLLNEVTEYLNPQPGKIYIDCTLGGAGHTEALLQKSQTQISKSKIYGFDLDKEALQAAKDKVSRFDNIEYIQD